MLIPIVIMKNGRDINTDKNILYRSITELEMGNGRLSPLISQIRNKNTDNLIELLLLLALLSLK